ncbi:hypothetical protein DH2020_018856 [Rehmannia glutinosa]|uniref:FRIGIDA-like protein n=1 Tax=Rehmannia glutinosa TaxID=99300 RepID=A0ABR0WNN2_REHGL
MATTAAVTPPPLTAEADPSAFYSFPEEQQGLTTIPDHPSNTSRSPKLETLPPAVPLPPLFINSVAELKDLSAAIASFQQCYDDLHNHLDSIKAAILSKLPPETPHVTPVVASSSQERDVSEASPKPNISEASPKPDVSEGTLLQKQPQEHNPPNSELEGLCKTMCSRDIRKYLATHLSNLSQLREEVPKALKLAPNPPKLVLECLGKFFLQGSKAFTRNSPMIPAREASILILECFLLMMGMDTTNGNDNGVLNMEKAVKEEAESAALAWRKRLVVEGGVSKANQIDARGLLLFVACFGIPNSFQPEDIRGLVVAANAKEIVGVLQKSHVLKNKIPGGAFSPYEFREHEIVEGMVKNKMEVDAVDIVYTFGLEERFNPQTILLSYLRNPKNPGKSQKKDHRAQQLRCQNFMLYLAFPYMQNEANKKQLATLKSIRKCLERHKIDPAKLLSGWQINEKITTLEKDIADADRKSSSQKRKASETETSKRPKTHEPKPVVYGGPGAGLLPESMIQSTSHAGLYSTVPYAGMHHGGVMVDTAGQVINRGTHPYVWHRDSAVNERYGGQSSSVGLTSLYRGPTSVEGFAGVQNVSSVGGLGNRGSDLYQFADSVVENESYPSNVPRSVAAVPSAVPAHHSSYLYQV